VSSPELWVFARSIRDHIEEWLVFKGLPNVIVSIKENERKRPHPRTYTFVVRIGRRRKVKQILAREIADNEQFIDLFAQTVANYFYRQLIKE
jgi:hypothetical protein